MGNKEQSKDLKNNYKNNWLNDYLTFHIFYKKKSIAYIGQGTLQKKNAFDTHM